MYLLAVHAIETDAPTDLPAVVAVGADFLLLYDPSIPSERMALAIWPEVRRVLGRFYDARFVAERLDDEIISLNEMNGVFTNLLAEYFEGSRFRVTLKRLGRRIRQSVGEMHVVIQSIASRRLDLARWQGYVREATSQSWLFGPVSRYLNEETGERFPFDREAQLRFIDYAASETINAAIVQATLWAGIVGAVAGGTIALLAK